MRRRTALHGTATKSTASGVKQLTYTLTLVVNVDQWLWPSVRSRWTVKLNQHAKHLSQGSFRYKITTHRDVDTHTHKHTHTQQSTDRSHHPATKTTPTSVQHRICALSVCRSVHILRLTSPHPTSSQLTSYSLNWVMRWDWVVHCNITQFAVAATNHSTLGLRLR